MTTGKYPCAVPEYQVETIEGETLLFHPSNRTIFRSNASAVLIWELCNGERTVADIIQVLCLNYPEAAAQIPQDVQNTLQMFSDHKAIVWL